MNSCRLCALHINLELVTQMATNLSNRMYVIIALNSEQLQ